VEPTKFEPRLKLKPGLKFFKFGLCCVEADSVSLTQSASIKKVRAGKGAQSSQNS